MNEHAPNREGQSRVEIGLDGKPFEVWEPAPQPTQHLDRAPSSADWVGGSYYPRGPAETAMLETPRQSIEFNHYAWYSIGLAVAALIGLAVAWVTGTDGLRMLPMVSFVMAIAGGFYGMRAHNASVRGFCTNGGLGRAGIAISVLSAVALAVDVVKGFQVTAGG